MIKLENYEVMGWEHAIRGMRNPMNSWEKSDSFICYADDSTCKFDKCPHFNYVYPPKEDDLFNPCPKYDYYDEDLFVVGANDHDLMMRLRNAGSDDRKFMRMLTIYVDITAPLYWWKEFDTYKVGTVANSCSTMHKIHAKAFELDDFSHEHLTEFTPNQKLKGWTLEENDLLALPNDPGYGYSSVGILRDIIIKALNFNRERCLETKDKKYWWQMIQLLPSSYNQKRTVMLNYEVLTNMYHARKEHKLDEWRTFCEWVETLPYSELITGIEKGE